MGFLDKNNDSLHASLEQLMAVSKDPFINKLFPEVAHKSGVNTKRLALDSVGSKFRVCGANSCILAYISPGGGGVHVP